MLDYAAMTRILLEECERDQSTTPFEDVLAVLAEYREADLRSALMAGRKARALCERRSVEFARRGWTNKANRLLEVDEQLLLLDARDDFDAYMLFMEWHRSPEKCFYRPRRSVFGPRVVRHMQALADDELDFLSLSCPPRVGKSTSGIFFLTWMMGRNPDRANVMSGHSDSLTAGFHVEALGLITDDATYRFAEVFPDAEFIGKSMAKETIQLKGSTERFPSLTCRSIEGTLTGAVEVGQQALLYLDDLVEDREQALNSSRMDKLYAAYLNQLKDRMKEGAKQLAVMTRWVPDDPIGRIEAEYAGSPRHRFVRVPALDEAGESNFDFPYGLGFSTAYYQDMRRSLEAAGEQDSWSAKYMADPYYKKGLMFPEDKLRRFDALPEGEPDAIIAACDTKDKGSDYAAQPIGYVYGQDHYMVAALCDNSLPHIFQPRLAKSLVEHQVQMARYESNAAGGRVADEVEELVREAGLPLSIEHSFSTANKETRILVDSGWILERCLFWAEPPDEDYRRFMSQLTHYTVEGKVAHDDAPDAMSMYKRFACGLVKAKAEAIKRPW